MDDRAAGLGDEIGRAQETLARALGRARIGEDRALANLVRELGERLAHLLSGLLRMTHLHSPDNSAFNKPVADLQAALVQLQDLLGSVHLVVVEDQVYVNDIRIRSGDKASSIPELGAELQRHNAGGITFHLPLDGPAIRAVVACVAAAAAPTEPRSGLVKALHAAGVRGLELQGRFRFRMASEDAREARDPRDFVSRALSATDEAFQNLAQGRVPNPLPLRRVVTEMLERGFAAEELWLERPDAPAYAFHQLRVAQLALVVGRALQLPQSVLQDLGTAALYHDCGYAAGGPAGAGVAVAFERHAAVGARLMLRQKGFHEAKTRRLLAILQHHRDANDPLGASSLRPRAARGGGLRRARPPQRPAAAHARARRDAQVGPHALRPGDPAVAGERARRLPARHAAAAARRSRRSFGAARAPPRPLRRPARPLSAPRRRHARPARAAARGPAGSSSAQGAARLP